MEAEKPDVPALRVEIEGPREKITADKIAEAIRDRLVVEPTDLLSKDDMLVLIVQHQVRGKPE